MADEFALLRNDLELTVKELSDSYEELSLLHRVSETLSGLDADEICRKIIDEALSSVDAQTAAVMLLDETLEELVTHTYRGKWRSSFVVKKVNSAFWDAIEKEKSIGICNIKKHNISKMLPDIKSILICPMIGKKRVIGVLVVADKYNSEEFFSNDIKLINAIARHAALFMENAVLSKEMESFLLGTIRAFVKALEATSYWTAGHTGSLPKSKRLADGSGSVPRQSSSGA